jgi:transposase
MIAVMNSCTETFPRPHRVLSGWSSAAPNASGVQALARPSFSGKPVTGLAQRSGFSWRRTLSTSASKPTDVQGALGADPFCGAGYVFRSKRMDRIKLVWWDGTGMRLESGRFRWRPIEDGLMNLDWSRIEPSDVAPPSAAL